METRFILSDYVDRAMDLAVYDKLEDGTFAGRIAACPGVIAFDSTLRGCEFLVWAAMERAIGLLVLC